MRTIHVPRSLTLSSFHIVEYLYRFLNIFPDSWISFQIPEYLDSLSIYTVSLKNFVGLKVRLQNALNQICIGMDLVFKVPNDHFLNGTQEAAQW